MVVAHRGASATHPENTLAAFQAARDQGARGIELDVRRTEDQVLVVHHNAHLADGRLISELAADELPDWIPTLAEVLDSTSDMWLNIEIKNLPDEPDYDAEDTVSVAVAGLVAAHLNPDLGAGAPDVEGDPADPALALAELYRRRVLVSSFNVDSIVRLQAVDPILPLGMLVWGQVDPASIIGRAEAHGFDAIHPHDLMVDNAFVRRCQQAGLDINVWTVDNPDRIVQLAGMGVDGIITNTPDKATEVLARAGFV